MKKILALAVVFALVFALTGCEGLNIDFSKPTEPSVNTEDVTENIPDASTGRSIVLEGDSVSLIGGGTSVSGNTVTVSAAGEYFVSGKLNDGQIVINTGEDAMDVTLHLCGADITNTRDSAIYVAQAKNVYLVLDEGTENKITSGTDATASAFDGTQNGAAIFSEDDLKISGSGSLTVEGKINNGITGKDDVDIKGGVITVNAVNNGIKGSESVDIKAGKISVTAGNDGIKATSALKEGKGFVTIDGSDIYIRCTGDGISAESYLTVNSGSITVESDGNVTQGSCKAIKAKTGLTVNGGTFSLSSSDHALHSGAGIDITGGTFDINSVEGKGISSHGMLNIAGGTFNINSYDDGIETATDLKISGGAFNVVSGANGIKAGEKGNGFTSDTGSVTITGGSFEISAIGNPINSHGTMNVNGATLFGVGASKTLKEFDEGSQAFISCSVSVASGAEVNVGDICYMTAMKGGSCVIFTDPSLVSGNEYIVSSSGSTVKATAK